MAETITYLEALRRGLSRALGENERVFLLGQDIGRYGGAFKLTEGFAGEFGEERIIDTPIVETGLIGAAIGAAMAGMRPVVEIQFIDFISCAFNQLTNFAATCHFRWGAGVPIVVRGPSGGGVHAGPFHSQNVESHFLNTPGLKIVIPATVEDVYRMILGAIEDPDPVLFFEQKSLYRTLKAPLDESVSSLPPGIAALRREGQNVSMISYGAMVHRVLEAAEVLSGEGVECDVLDLRSLNPLDRSAILETTRKTGKILVIHEDNLTGGAGGEIAAFIAEHGFEDLDAPVRRLAALDVPIPYSGILENAALPQVQDITEAAHQLAAW
ncbi:MAG TPA: alpha-ketoacid dehydrogenase subunit beta [Planctomycetes bacterium]|nr:alpha-ketoacid dehydrogenase subunit beta [Planctomycetota bacterium]HIN81036.1 alpha-ketoacid dehydrogenase subunit beta [Planctomycetota bacterium]